MNQKGVCDFFSGRGGGGGGGRWRRRGVGAYTCPRTLAGRFPTFLEDFI